MKHFNAKLVPIEEQKRLNAIRGREWIEGALVGMILAGLIGAMIALAF